MTSGASVPEDLVEGWVRLSAALGKTRKPRFDQAWIWRPVPNEAIYVAARLFRTDPRAIRTSITRRDGESDAETFTVSFDTYLDRRTAYSFTVSSGGVRGDAYHSQDSEDAGREPQFDPIWNARTRVDSGQSGAAGGLQQRPAAATGARCARLVAKRDAAARLTTDEISELTASMLGDEVGYRPAVLELLERETEGNVFFLVEVVRTLAG